MIHCFNDLIQLDWSGCYPLFSTYARKLLYPLPVPNCQILQLCGCTVIMKLLYTWHTCKLVSSIELRQEMAADSHLENIDCRWNGFYKCQLHSSDP